MSGEPIRYFNRAKRVVETEQVYGEKWLRWAYETGLGEFTGWLLLRRAFLSHWYGWRMSKRISAQRVLPFILDYNLDPDEFARKPLEFNTFNEFFYRALKKEARPITAGDEVAVLPADGRHLVFPNVDAAEGFYVKGQTLSVTELLGDVELGKTFAGGSLVISRLCPVDYHRFHFPVAGVPTAPRLVNGWLGSVSPIALRRNLRFLVENKRAITLIDSPRFGRVAMLEIGATFVGTIKNVYVEDRAVAKGEEKGFFKFGGSCVILVFEKNRIRFDADLVEQSRHCVETYAKMGERLGVATR